MAILKVVAYRSDMLAHSAYVCCHRTECPLLMSFFCFFSLSPDVYPIFYSRWNPFARKSRGILGVIKAQAKRNRVVSKHGRINVYRKTEDNENQHRFEKQNTFSLSLFYSVQTFTTSVSNIVYVNHNSDLSDRNCYLHTYVG